jgi:hypothetical protein
MGGGRQSRDMFAEYAMIEINLQGSARDKRAEPHFFASIRKFRRELREEVLRKTYSAGKMPVTERMKRRNHGLRIQQNDSVQVYLRLRKTRKMLRMCRLSPKVGRFPRVFLYGGSGKKV